MNTEKIDPAAGTAGHTPIQPAEQNITPTDYIENGWTLVPIEPGTKGPTAKGWNTFPNCIDTLEKLEQYKDYSFGLGHAYSGTCAIDIDDWERTKAMFWVEGIDLKALCQASDAVIIQGRNDRAKLLYRLPEGMAPLRTKSIGTRHPETGESIMVVEFRCATAGGMTVQDVLPPSIHPGTGKPYRWEGAGDPLNPPVLPGPLLDLWQELVTRPERPTRPRAENMDRGEVESALYAIDPDGLDYDSWLEIMMAVNATGEEWAGDLFLDWSAQSGKDVPRTTAYKWRSLDPDGDVGPATLFKRAKDAGWSCLETAADMFADIPVAEGQGQGTSGDEPGDEADDLADEPEIKVATYVYVRNHHKFIDTRDNQLIPVPQMNCMFPMNKTNYAREFFSHEREFGREVVKDLTYLPMGPRVHGGDYNVWKGSSVRPIESDVTMWLHLAERLVPVREERDHLLDWMAYTVQHPEIKINHAILMVSRAKGVGKDTFVAPFIQALGKHNCKDVAADVLTKDFNSYLDCKKLVIFQEIMDFVDKGKVSNSLKPVLAAPPDTLTINQKHVKEYEIPNIVQAIFFSNHMTAMHIEDDERRYFCLLSECGKLVKEEAKSIWQWYGQGGHEAVMHYLLSRDVSQFEPHEPPPITQFHKDLVTSSRTELEQKILEVIEDYPERFQVFLLGTLKMELPARIGNRQITDKAIGNILRKLGFMKTQHAFNYNVYGEKDTRRDRIWYAKDFNQQQAKEQFKARMEKSQNDTRPTQQKSERVSL